MSSQYLMITPATLFAELAGSWIINRTINQQISMTGWAEFSPRNEGELDYHEMGALNLTDGQSYDAERRYIYRAHQQGFDIYFAESIPRLFQHVAFEKIAESLRGMATHDCPPDYYVSNYIYDVLGKLLVETKVNGPRKDYLMRTIYSRLM